MPSGVISGGIYCFKCKEIKRLSHIFNVDYFPLVNGAATNLDEFKSASADLFDVLPSQITVRKTV